MKIDPLVIHLCEKAEIIGEKVEREKDEKVKVKLLLEANKYLRLAVFLHQSSNCVVLVSFLEIATFI
jgi:hypothetical protein